MSILTYPLNDITYDAEDAETYLCTRTSGVFAENGHYQASVTGTREVTISSGLAWIRNADFHGKAVYNSEPVAVTVPVADGAVGRIDRIVLRFDKSANATTIELLQGTAASSPTPPAVTQTEELYELGLCTVNVGASAVSLSAADVTSTLLDESVCGLMRDGVTQIPTEQLQEQVVELLERLGEAITGIETGANIMTLDVYDTEGGKRQVAFEDTVNASIRSLTNALTDGSVTKVGTVSVGGTARGIYLNAGTPTALSATIGSATQPVYMSSGTITASTSTVGSGTKPVYLSSGTITASSSTVGSGTKPVYLSSGTITASSSTVGSSTTPVYLSSGTITACSAMMPLSGSTFTGQAYAYANTNYTTYQLRNVYLGTSLPSASTSYNGSLAFIYE